MATQELNGSEGKGEGGDGSPPLDPIAAQATLSSAAPPPTCVRASSTRRRCRHLGGAVGGVGGGLLAHPSLGGLPIGGGHAGVPPLGGAAATGAVWQGALTPSEPPSAAPAMIQGVLPFPGQGVLELQQGVLDHTGRALDPFNYLARGRAAAHDKGGAATAAPTGAAVSARGGGASATAPPRRRGRAPTRAANPTRAPATCRRARRGGRPQLRPGRGRRRRVVLAGREARARGPP